MSTEGVSNDESGEEVNVISSQGPRNVIEGQHIAVSKHMENISSLVMESSQLKVDALKCFGDNVAEMKKLEEETGLKAEAFRKLVAMVGMAVGVSNSNSH